MKNKIQKVFISTLFLCTMSFIGFAQSNSEPKSGTVVAGVGVESVMVGISTLASVENAYGTKYERIEHKKYSIEFDYRSLGLSFYACMADPNKQIFDIEITKPYIAMTPEGVMLGTTTKEEIEKLYKDIRGIDFQYDEKNIVKTIDVFESDGLRQCDSKFGVLKEDNGQ